MEEPFRYETIPISGFTFSFESQGEPDGSCRLCITPFQVLKWPDSVSLFLAEIHYYGSPCDTQSVEVKTNDEFGVQQVDDLCDVLKKLREGQDLTYEMRGNDGVFELGMGTRAANVELSGRIGLPYLPGVFEHPENVHLRENTLFGTCCDFRLRVPRSYLSHAIVELNRFSEYLQSMGARGC